MTHTRACAAFLSVCLCALFHPVSAIGAEARPASADRFLLTTPAPGGVELHERPVVTNDFSDPLAAGGEGPEMAIVPAGTFQMGCL